MDPSNVQQPPPQPTDALTQYMQNYGQRLQSAIADNVDAMGTPQVPSAGDLGPDLYQSSNVRLTQQPPPPSALAPQQGGGQGASPPQAPSPKGSSQADPNAGQSALDADSQKQTSFQDIWNQQSAKQRTEFINSLQKKLDATNETINSAYDTMMKQLGQRPQTDLNREDKGRLLMEFGLRMLSHSAGQSTAQAVGQAGSETLNSYQQQHQQRLANQQRYDQMQQQLTQAHDRDVVNLNSRSALEQGRDLRAAQASDASITRAQMQQTGQDSRQGAKNAASADRTNARSASALDRTEITEGGKNQRAALSAGQLKGTITGADGTVYGLDKNGKMTQLKDQNGDPVKPAPGQSGIGAGKKSATQQNFDMYMSVYGKDEQGQPLSGQALQDAQEKALKYASNPRATADMSETDMRKVAAQTANNLIRSNSTAFLGFNPDDLQKKQAEIAEQTYQRLKRGQPPIAGGMGGKPQSALGTPPQTGGAAPAPAGAPQSALTAPPGQPAKPAGAVPTQPQPNMPSPNAKQLALLQQNPGANARFFLQKFGYLPAGYQRYINVTAQPQSALGH